MFHIYHIRYALHTVFVQAYHEIISTAALESYAWVQIPALNHLSEVTTLGEVLPLAVKWEDYLPQSDIVRTK